MLPLICSFQLDPQIIGTDPRQMLADHASQENSQVVLVNTDPALIFTLTWVGHYTLHVVNLRFLYICHSAWFPDHWHRPQADIGWPCLPVESYDHGRHCGALLCYSEYYTFARQKGTDCIATIGTATGANYDKIDSRGMANICMYFVFPEQQL